MLTNEILKQNEKLAALTEEQLSAIAALSANDEAAVVGGLQSKYTNKIKELAGEDKQQGEDAVGYMSRVFGGLKNKAGTASELEKQIEAAKQRAAELEKQIASGKGNEALAQQMKDKEGQISQLTALREQEKTAWEQEKTGFAKQLTDIKVGAEFGKAFAGLKFKAEYPESVQKTLIAAAKDGILATAKPDFVEAGGEKHLIFRDQNGEILRNKANGLNPYTPAELLAERLKDALDFGKKAEGAGTNGEGRAAATGVDISGSKTQVEADEAIKKDLMSRGFVRGTADFASKHAELRKEAAVEKLPVR